MKVRFVAIVGFVVALAAPGGALCAAEASPTPAKPVVEAPHRMAVGHRAGHPGPKAVTPTSDYVQKPKSKQEIADEKRLERDLKICIGC